MARFWFSILEYKINIDTLPASCVYLAAERPENMSYSVNGYALEYDSSDGFWIDSCFKKMKIPSNILKLGENVISVKLNFKRTSNIEAIYLIGSFGVNIDEAEKRITSLPERIGFGRLERYNLPFYTGKVTYKIPYSYLEGIGELLDNQKAVICAKKFTGAYAEVISDKKNILSWEPYECDITDIYKDKKDVYVSVMGTRRNTFGPLHLYPAIQYCYGPDSFKTSGDNWTYEYSLIDSGLSEIELKVIE